eukprot:868904-Pelagomonas_calceolata.AAC.2
MSPKLPPPIFLPNRYLQSTGSNTRIQAPEQGTGGSPCVCRRCCLRRPGGANAMAMGCAPCSVPPHSHLPAIRISRAIPAGHC